MLLLAYASSAYVLLPANRLKSSLGDIDISGLPHHLARDIAESQEKSRRKGIARLQNPKLSASSS